MIRTYQDTYLSYAKRVAAETETEETAHYPQEKDRLKTNDVRIEIEKGKEEKKKIKISQHQQRKKERWKKTARKGSRHA